MAAAVPTDAVSRRVLVVSSDPGAGGRDGAAGAGVHPVAEEVRRRFSGSHLRTVVLPRLRVAPAARAARRLVPVVDLFDPDLVIAADPPAAAVLARLRHRGLGVPVATPAGPGTLTPAGPDPPRPWPMRGRDALFWYVDSPAVPQLVGAVLRVGPRPDGRPLTRDALVELLRRRLPALTTLRRVPVPRGRRRPGWRIVDVDPAAHIGECRLPAGAGPTAGAGVIDRFWSEPVPADRPPWQLLLLTGAAGGEVTLAMKLHHCLGDGLSIIGTVVRLLDRAGGAGSGGESAGAAGPGGEPAGAAGPGGEPAGQNRARRRHAVRTARGLVRLATAGRSPRTAVNRRSTTPRRRLVTTSLPASDVARVARHLRVHRTELLCALVAEALHRCCPGTAPQRMRAMFPVSRRSGERAPTQGNWTGAVTLDLPTGPMPVPDRVAIVRKRLRQGLTSGEPAAADLVLRAIGALPGWLHAMIARRIYRSPFLSVIVSYLDGPRGHHLLAGAPIRDVVPVVGLAEGVLVGVGLMRWADRIGIGVLLDESLAGLGSAVVAAVRDGFAAARP